MLPHIKSLTHESVAKVAVFYLTFYGPVIENKVQAADNFPGKFLLPHADHVTGNGKQLIWLSSLNSAKWSFIQPVVVVNEGTL